MVNILVVDDVQDNLDVMEILIEEYMEDHDMSEYKLTLLDDSREVIPFLEKNSVHILFLDIMMPHIDGFEILKMVRGNKNFKQPIIVMATALGDDTTKYLEEKLGANAYMVKPIKHTTIKIMLDKYIALVTHHNAPKSVVEDADTDDGFDFDFDFDDGLIDDSMASDMQIDSNVSKDLSEIELIIENQNRLVPLSAHDLLVRYEWNIDSINNRLEELNYLLYQMFDSLEHDPDNFEIDLEYDLKVIIEIIDEYYDFVSLFVELIDIKIVLGHLKDTLELNDFRVLTPKKQNYLGILIKAIMSDLIEFKDKVFEDQDVANIYYLNASVASSCLDLEAIFDVN